MSSSQVDPKSSTKRAPVEVVGWDELIRYTQFLCQGTDKKVKICTIDEEQEEIRIENKDEFEVNVKYGRDHGLTSLSLVVYINDVHIFDGIYHLINNEKSLPIIVEEKEKKIVSVKIFPEEKLQILIDNVLADKWYIPVKVDEALGVCILSAIELAREGKLESNTGAKQFCESIVPEAFRKLQNTQSVFSWPREIQYGIFEMLELLVDLVGTRLRYPPVPVTLLNTLALAFDTNTTFAQKHKQEQLPSRRVYVLPDQEFVRTGGNDQMSVPYGWLRSLLQRFIAQNGVTNVRFQFELINDQTQTFSPLEYNALLKLFTKCHQCIDAHRFRTLFERPIRQAVQFVSNKKKTEANVTDNKLAELTDTLLEICFNYEMNDEISELVQQSPPVTESPPVTPPIVPSKKTKSKDCYERLADDLRSMSMSNGDVERKNVKKQRTDEQIPMPLFTRSHLTDCIDEMLTSSEKRTLKRKHLKEQQRSSLTLINGGNVSKKENKRSNTIAVIPKTYDRTDSVDIVRFFAPLKLKISALYDELETATCRGHLRDVLKIEEKLKLLRPYSARFIADENTPDGTPMRPGQAFRKGWILLNDGSLPWTSEDVQLVNLADGIRVVQQPIVPVTAPHARVHITVDYVCSEEPGTYESKWILTYRQQTFGPMIWCSIEVAKPKNAERNTASPLSFSEFKESFELIDVPLPACFDLTKPFISQRANFALPRSTSTDISSNNLDLFNDQNDHSPAYSFDSDTNSLSGFLFSSVPSPPLLRQVSDSYPPMNPSLEDPTSLIELAPPAAENKQTETVLSLSHHHERQPPARLSPPLDFVDSVVTNLFTVAKHAGSTAKAIFHTLQAIEEPSAPVAPQVQEQAQPTLINTSTLNQTSADDFFEHVEDISNPSANAQDPMQMLIEMGFANRAKNQRLLEAHQDDLAKVIEMLTLDSIDDDSDWFAHRH